ncbi:JmjC domain, hydroxylase-domain-containing protein [Thelonectria olida]|uniref:JmjC domain, hydroxylase-domain-containing protein n=1 Tax=Thelonectria olida TaxID=1576542 RepID=A0A9P8WHD4_9HYPO|nr:JmjC domain, hydroxylase-domain-containing protein [Thelonectria olida]
MDALLPAPGAATLPAVPQEPPPDIQPEANLAAPVAVAVAFTVSHNSPPENEADQGPLSDPTTGLIQPASATHLQINDEPPLAGTLPFESSRHQEPVSFSDASALPKSPGASSDLSEPDPSEFAIDYDYDGPDGHRILRLKPTLSQWDDFAAILAFARHRGADDDGCFKIILPSQLQEALPEKTSPHKVPANAYRPTQSKKNSFWRVNTVLSEGTFVSTEPGPEYNSSALEAFDDLRRMFHKNNRKQIRNVRYRVDVPAWTPEQRRAAGVPERSPIHPLKGDKLDYTRAIIPGIHTPYVYESGPHFGASFQIHAEDFRLVSLNHLYKGRKIWITVPSTAVDIAEEALGRKRGCSQFMRHRAEFFFPQKLDKLGIPYRIVDQRPGETIVILPDAYHEGFSTGYTIAEAKNYADGNWTTDTYQPCEAKCQLVTAIPADLMRPLEEGETRLDLCAAYTSTDPEENMSSNNEVTTPEEVVPSNQKVTTPMPAKRSLDNEDDPRERDMKRIKA